MTLTGCAQLHLEEGRFEPVEDAGSPSTPSPDPVRDGAVDALPSVRILSPEDGASVGNAMLRIEGTAKDDRNVASVFVKVGPNTPIEAHSDDGFATFWIEAAVPQGTFDIEAVAYDGQKDGLGRALPGEADHITVHAPITTSDDDAPTIAIDTPEDGSTPIDATVRVIGTASDDRAVTRIELYLNDELKVEPSRPVETDDFYGHWSREVALIPGVDNVLRFVAHDASGHTGEASITLYGRPGVDRDPPKLIVTSPADGDVLNTAQLTVTGTSGDDRGVREVKLRLGRIYPGSTTLTWGEYEPARSEDEWASWNHSFPMPTGPFSVEARAIDINGLGTSVTLSLVSSYVAPWSEEVAVPLRLYDENASPTLRFELDEQGVNDVIDRDIQEDITLLELDTTTLLRNAVNQIKDSCGTRWRENNENPRHDCAGTDYGQNQTPQVPWQDSAEYSFVRLLTMTPKNAVVSGTSVSQIEGIADALGIGGGFHEILGDTLGIPVTQEVVSTNGVVRALQDFWMADHPAVLPGGKLPITLYDGMQDLAPLKDKFGPVAGVHPGLIDPSFTPHSRVFGDDFQMILEADSNLRWMDGLDLGKGALPDKDYMALVVDRTGPTYDDVLEFDFTSAQKFDVRGLVESPRANLRMAMNENNAFVRSCTAQNSTCRNNLPSAPAGGYVWANPRYQVETLVAAGAYYDYRGRTGHEKTYRTLLFIPSAWVTVGAGGDPGGWATFDTLLSIGSPPPDQYLWELILEIGQVALHNFSGKTLAEGRANVKFTVRDIDVGLTANEIRAAMRPKLQEQRHTLSERLLGNYEENNGALDFFYRLGADGKAYLMFAAESDPRPADGYDYAKPGFFADEGLTTKVSAKDIPGSGDDAHEKLALAPGQSVVYVQDDAGDLFRLRFEVPDDVGDDPAREITVFAAKRTP